MRAILTREAETDLEAIADWIAKDSPRRALTFISQLREACLQLADQPHAWPLIQRYEEHGVRRRTHGDYLIFYRTNDQQIDIVHILHGARDYIPLLFPD